MMSAHYCTHGTVLICFSPSGNVVLGPLVVRPVPALLLLAPLAVLGRPLVKVLLGQSGLGAPLSEAGKGRLLPKALQGCLLGLRKKPLCVFPQ